MHRVSSSASTGVLQGLRMHIAIWPWVATPPPSATEQTSLTQSYDTRPPDYESPKLVGLTTSSSSSKRYFILAAIAGQFWPSDNQALPASEKF